MPAIVVAQLENGADYTAQIGSSANFFDPDPGKATAIFEKNLNDFKETYRTQIHRIDCFGERNEYFQEFRFTLVDGRVTIISLLP